MGNPRGMNNCGLMYESGFEGQPADAEKAEQMYRQAHKHGNLDATINLAFCYLATDHKLGPEQGRIIATALLKYAYKNGKVDARDYLEQYNLVRSGDEMLVEVVNEADEQGVDSEL